MFRKALSSLEKLDEQIEQLQRSMHESRQKIASVLEQKQNIVNKKKVATERLSALSLQLKNIELELAAIEQEIAKLEKQRLQLTDERSLSALVQRLSTLSSKKLALEDDWFVCTENLELGQEVILQVTQGLDNLNPENKIDLLNQEIRQTGRQLRELEDQRSSFYADLGLDWSGRYEKLRLRHPEKRVVFAMESEFCPSCNMQLNRRVYERMRYNNDVINCSFCGSILFWPLKEDYA